ncbi:unnamed protein product [Lymnaea stagnalis]|uniref:Uncharacterized protein n=1 Tax=Lymnaea stagnalis TaxID=6523 RepID=A0AAV2H8M3_LYMST
MGEVTAVDCLALPKRQKVFEKTFLPVGDVLPVWSNVSLDTKLPVPPSPSGKFTLYTNKLGEPKYISRQRYDFDLTNPRGREAPGPYDSLADPSLKYYFTSPRARRHLVETGLVTDRGEIKCTVQEFNQYREFIRYRAVTELALQKKRESRLKEEDANRLFVDWPVSCHVDYHDDSCANIRTHKLNKVERHKQTMSEPPRKNWTIGGLEMYEQNLANVFKKRKEKKDGRSKNKSHLKKKNYEKNVQTIKSTVKINPEKTDEDNENETVEENNEQNKNDRGKTSEEEQTDEEVNENKTPESTRSIHRSTNLVKELRQREQELHQRLKQQQRRRAEEHDRKIEENWRERQQRQELLLQHEAEIEAMIKEKRLHQIREREATLLRQRRKQEEQLMKIKKELAGASKQRHKPKPRANNHGKGDNKGE